MKINKDSFEITTSQYDYNVPVRFEAYTDEIQNFKIGDKIIFEFDSDKIKGGEGSLREYTVDKPEYAFYFQLTKEEANNIFAESLKFKRRINYSIKLKRTDDTADPPKESLLTIVDSVITFVPTLKLTEDQNG